MKVAIIGSGLAGVTTAYLLASRGHAVTVIDRAAGPALETSFANGALLTPSMADPWNAPGCWRILLASIGRSDSPLQLRLRSLPALARWGVGFLRNSNRATFKRNTLRNLRLAQYSLEMMEVLRRRADIDYGRAARGTLRVFRTQDALKRASAAADGLRAQGLSYKRFSATETVAFEPALAAIGDRLAGAVYYSIDESGDAYRFCVVLAEHARRMGVEFRFGCEAARLETHRGSVAAIVTQRERLTADQYVIAAGSYSTGLLRDIGIYLPVQPAKGYSITFNHYEAQPRLTIPLVDDDLHAVVVPLEQGIRVAGTAEFAGYDLTLHPARTRNLLGLLHRVLPQGRFDSNTARPWCGLRPMSVDGLPIIGHTPLRNLLVNTGHGHLGWTMAAGSAQLVTDLMCGSSTSIDPTPYALNRF